MNREQQQDANTGSKLGIIGDITTALTLLAALPYELGAVGIMVPPEWKPWVAGIGLFATLALRLAKRWKELQATPPPK